MSTEASAVTIITARQVKAACALLGWSEKDLARGSGLTEEAVSAILGGDDPAVEERVLEALETAGVVFLGADGRGIGVRLRPNGPPDEGMRPDELTSENDG